MGLQELLPHTGSSPCCCFHFFSPRAHAGAVFFPCSDPLRASFISVPKQGAQTHPKPTKHLGYLHRDVLLVEQAAQAAAGVLYISFYILFFSLLFVFFFLQLPWLDAVPAARSLPSPPRPPPRQYSAFTMPPSWALWYNRYKTRPAGCRGMTEI